jgi:response regulator RpfG family c-di-GMP phosphodiesterase/anti-anti-sigma regulatory factor
MSYLLQKPAGRNGVAATTVATTRNDAKNGNSGGWHDSLADVAAAQQSTTKSASVLVVDDEEAVATVLSRGLSYAGFEVATARSGQEALERLAERHFDALLTDIHMPRLRGDEMQRIARERDPDLAVLLITAADETACAVECLKDGVFDYLTKPFDLSDVVVRVRKALERRELIRENNDYRQNLEARVVEQAERLRKMMQGSLESLIHALEAKDPTTHNHSARVADLATVLATRVRPGDTAFGARVRVAALFHDIGKIGVPESVLNKREQLEEHEMALVKRHPEIGETILRPLLDEETVAMVRGHHEHVSGAGYPDGLKGEAIPLGGRIIAVADAYDAMTSTRPYRPEITQPHVLEILRDGVGRQWDAVVVEALLTMAAEGRLGERQVRPSTPEETAALAADIAEAREMVTSGPDRSQLRPVTESAKTPPNSRGVGNGVGAGTRPILQVRAVIDSAAIHILRTEFEALLRRGQTQIVIDFSSSASISADSAQCIYALDLQARRAGGRITLRDVPLTVMAQFQDAGLARMLRFEQSTGVERN